MSLLCLLEYNQPTYHDTSCIFCVGLCVLVAFGHSSKLVSHPRPLIFLYDGWVILEFVVLCDGFCCDWIHHSIGKLFNVNGIVAGKAG